MKPFLTPLFLPLFLHIITVHVAGDTSPIYTPVDDITLQCGFSYNQLNYDDNRIWAGDINSMFSPSISRQAPFSSSVSQVPYSTARLSRSEFTYRFRVTTGQKFVRLYFYPASYGPGFDRSKALFSVKAGSFTLLKDFNSSVTADASESDTIYREFCLNVGSEQSLNITFMPSRATADAYAFINGIEIVSMPDNLYYTSAQNSDGVNYVGSKNPFRIENSTALEMVYRFNVGGRSLVFTQDTGMYRNWDGEKKEYEYLDYLDRIHSFVNLDFGYVWERRKNGENVALYENQKKIETKVCTISFQRKTNIFVEGREERFFSNCLYTRDLILAIKPSSYEMMTTVTILHTLKRPLGL